jgi:protein O-mannosyl-transferase
MHGGIRSEGRDETARARALGWSWLPYLVLFILGFAFYANTIPNDYASDDRVVITGNPFTQRGLKGIADILSRDTFAGFYGDQVSLVTGGRYRPLSLVTFAIEQQLLGQNPHASHLINALLYGLTGVILYGLLATLLASHHSRREWYVSLPFVATLFWVVHPLHTEVVANIKGRDDILALLGALLALRYTLRYLDTNKLVYLVTSFIVFSLALLAKESAMTFVAVVPLTVFFFTDHRARKNLVSTVPLLAAAVAFVVLRHEVLSGTRSSTWPDLMNNPYLTAPKAKELATVFYTWLIYLKLLVFPHPLTYDYYPKQIDIIGLGDPRAIVSILAWSAVAILAVRGLKRKGLISYGIWFSAITFSIVSNLFFNVGTFMSERFMYVPSIGFCLIAAYLLVRLVPRPFKREQVGRGVLSGILVAIACLCGAAVTSRNRVWANDYTLATHDVLVSTKSAKSPCAAATMLAQEADKLRKIRTTATSPKEIVARMEQETLLPKAERAEFLARDNLDDLRSKMQQRESDVPALTFKYLNRALQVHPTYFGAMLLLAEAYVQYDGDCGKAAEIYIQALRVAPQADIVYFSLENVLKQCDVDLQVKMWEDVLQAEPDRFEPNFRLGILYGHYRKDLDKAVPLLEKATELDPLNAEAYNNLGVAYGMAGRPQEGIRALEQAAKLNPTDAQVYVNLGVAYRSIGNEAKALECSTRAEELRSGVRRGENRN